MANVLSKPKNCSKLEEMIQKELKRRRNIKTSYKKGFMTARDT